MKITNNTIGQTTIRSRTSVEIREAEGTRQRGDKRPTYRGVNVNVYQVEVTNDSGSKFTFGVTRDTLHDNRDGTSGSPSRGDYGHNGEAPPGHYRGRWVDSDATGRALRIYDPTIPGNSTIRGPDGDRIAVQVHAGNCSEGCPLVRGTTIPAVESQMNALQAEDRKNGKGTDIYVDIEDRNNPTDNFHLPEADEEILIVTPSKPPQQYPVQQRRQP